MNRVFRLTKDTEKANFSLENQAKLFTLLSQYFSAKYQNLFAHGKYQNDGSIIWNSSLSGHPIPLSSFSGLEAEKNTRIISERLNDIKTIAKQLAGDNRITQEEYLLLEKASVMPEIECIFFINNQPVITWWPRISPLPIVPVIPASSSEAIEQIKLPQTQNLPKKKRWLSLILLFLLLLLLALLFSWLRGCFDPTTLTPTVNTVNTPSPTVIQPDPNLSPLQLCIFEQMKQTDMKEESATIFCQKSLAQLEIKPQTSSVNKICPVNRTSEQAPQVVIIFDASYSMILNMNLTAKQLNYIERTGKTIQGFDAEPRRISVAKNSVLDIVSRIPNDMDIMTIVASDCGNIRSTGYIPPANRGKLLQFINKIQPDGGTPLAEAITKVNKSIKKSDRETIIILISDGEESCNQDPCAAARILKRTHPKAVINVIDILGTGAGNCVAKATGGKVFTANNTTDITRMMEEAINDYIPEGCE